MTKRKPTVIDLFAGAGLLSYAFAQEGFRMVGAVETDECAARTYALNLGGPVHRGDVREARPEGACDVLIAGPPCQGFSTLGKRDEEDPRNRLVLELLRWARACRPSVIIVENVPAFLRSPVWHEMADGFREMGHEVSAQVLNAVDFGVPQRRQRSFTTASLLGVPVIEPIDGSGSRTVRAAWEGLPDVPDGRNHHRAPSPSKLALARMLVIPEGGDRRDIMREAPELAAPSWWDLGCQVTDVWGRMKRDEPANTLRTAFQNASKGRYIHPAQNRVITLREGARLQSIPDSWTFDGPPARIARQIGNSVAPRVGRAVARGVMRVLTD